MIEDVLAELETEEKELRAVLAWWLQHPSCARPDVEGIEARLKQIKKSRKRAIKQVRKSAGCPPESMSQPKEDSQ